MGIRKKKDNSKKSKTKDNSKKLVPEIFHDSHHLVTGIRKE